MFCISLPISDFTFTNEYSFYFRKITTVTTGKFISNTASYQCSCYFYNGMQTNNVKFKLKRLSRTKPLITFFLN